MRKNFPDKKLVLGSVPDQFGDRFRYLDQSRSLIDHLWTSFLGADKSGTIEISMVNIYTYI